MLPLGGAAPPPESGGSCSWIEVVLSRIPLAVSAKLVSPWLAGLDELVDGPEVDAGGGTVGLPPLATVSAACVLAAAVGGATCVAAAAASMPVAPAAPVALELIAIAPHHHHPLPRLH